jgi:hypothetical protein
MRRTPRRLLLVLAAAVAALALTGCVNITSFTASQPSPVGSVRITTQLCRGGSANCGDDGNGNFNPGSGDAKTQLLIAYRVTAGSIPPPSVRFENDGSQGPEFVPSPSYTAELQRLSPVAGQQWFGYIAPPFTYAASATSGTIVADFGLPSSADGTPLSDYAYLVVAGWRATLDNTDVNRPVSCGSSLTTPNDTAICIDAPAPNDVTSWKTLALHDVGISGGTSAPVQPGGTTTIPFTLRTNGTPAVLILSVSAYTGAPSGSATAAPAAITLSPNASAGATVRVAVAEGTPPGDYPVTLSVSDGSFSRSGQGVVRVVRSTGTGGGGGGGGAAAGLPSISAKVAPKSIGRTRKAKPAVVTATLSEAGTVQMVVTRSATGRRKGRACVAPTPKLVSGGAKRCTRFVPVTTITKANLGAGARTIPFSGRGRAAGSYRLTLTLRAGGQVSRPAVVTVTVTAS